MKINFVQTLDQLKLDPINVELKDQLKDYLIHLPTEEFFARVNFYIDFRNIRGTDIVKFLEWIEEIIGQEDFFVNNSY